MESPTKGQRRAGTVSVLKLFSVLERKFIIGFKSSRCMKIDPVIHFGHIKLNVADIYLILRRLYGRISYCLTRLGVILLTIILKLYFKLQIPIVECHD